MSVRSQVRGAIVELLASAPALANVQITPTRPGEDQALLEAIWVERVMSRFEWRGLGGLAGYQSNRSETLTVELGVDAYREAPRQLDASRAAVDRVDELLAAIETTIATDPMLGIGVTAALVNFTDVSDQARQGGWAALGTCRIQITNYPT